MRQLTRPTGRGPHRALRAALIAISLLPATGCTADVEGGGRAVGEGTYAFEIRNAIDPKATVSYGPAGTETVWSPDIGTVVLGPEDHVGPQVQLILAIEGVRAEGTRADVTSATMSMTNMRVGTADQLKAKAFTRLQAADCNILSDVEIGANYIRATFCIAMERIIVNPGDRAEQRLLQGSFTAVEP